MQIQIEKTFRACIVALLFVAGCAHHVDPAHELHTQLEPFTSTRDQAVHLVTVSKQSLGPDSVNQLSVSYTALEAKGNDYAGFLNESASTSSLDTSKNKEYATSLSNAIDSFNSSFATIDPQQAPTSKLSNTWIPAFSDSVQHYWNQYHAALSAESPQKKTALTQQLKADTVWPNFEKIGTEPVSPTPHP